jgi:hypothetical protein
MSKALNTDVVLRTLSDKFALKTYRTFVSVIRENLGHPDGNLLYDILEGMCGFNLHTPFYNLEASDAIKFRARAQSAFTVETTHEIGPFDMQIATGIITRPNYQTTAVISYGTSNYNYVTFGKKGSPKIKFWNVGDNTKLEHITDIVKGLRNSVKHIEYLNKLAGFMK